MAEGGGEDAGEKTEAASPLRLERARAEGKVAVSKEACGFAALLAGVGALMVAWPSTGLSLVAVLRGALANSGEIGDGAIANVTVLGAMAKPVAIFLLPILIAGAIGGAGASLLQSGFVLHLKGLAPDLSRIDPKRGVGRLLSPTALFEQGKAVAKLAAFGFVAFDVMRTALRDTITILSRPVEALGPMLGHLMARAILSLLAVQAVIAGADILWVRASQSRSLRMSRQDLKDEQKESDGDPQVKGRLRAMRRRLARRRMMQAVPTAAVVLTNPTHYAVALAYTRGSKAAPIVVAKGADEVAARIRAIAREHRVPLVANPPLARALFTVKLDQEVPAEHFRAVAAVIAYVWQLAQRRAAPV